VNENSINFADPGASADLAVVLMQEGLAHILLVGRRLAISFLGFVYIYYL